MPSRSRANRSTARWFCWATSQLTIRKAKRCSPPSATAREERIRILSVQDSALVNALQRRAAVVLQKSLREGFGLTVTEAMWKGAAVIGGNVGGIKHQIEDGVNGFLVDNVEQAADRIVDILKDPALRDRVGETRRRR